MTQEKNELKIDPHDHVSARVHCSKVETKMIELLFTVFRCQLHYRFY